MFDVQLTDSDTGADLTFGAHQVHLLAQVIKELPFSIIQNYTGIILWPYLPHLSPSLKLFLENSHSFVSFVSTSFHDSGPCCFAGLPVFYSGGCQGLCAA